MNGAAVDGGPVFTGLQGVLCRDGAMKRRLVVFNGVLKFGQLTIPIGSCCYS